MPDNEFNEFECLRWAAYHEAGHSVISVLFGQTVKFVKIRSDGGGCTKSFGFLNLDQRIMILQAGCVCLEAFNIISVDTGGAVGDYAEIITLLDEYFPDKTEAEKNEMQTCLLLETKSLLQDNLVKSVVEVLSTELLEKRTLDGERVHELVDPILTGGAGSKLAIVRRLSTRS